MPSKSLNDRVLAEAMSNLGFDPMALARAVIKAVDGDVIELSSRRDR
jgi:hypothetical protein